MTPLDWSGVSETSAFSVARVTAIEFYAHIERTLADLLASLLHISQDRAELIFFRITNTRSRNLIITELLKKEFGDKYTAYWHGTQDTPNRRGLMTLIQRADNERNEIVHWHVVHDTEPFLTKPNMWDYDISRKTWNTEDLKAFVDLADFIARSVSVFDVVVTGWGGPPEQQETWRDIFSKPALYPPPPQHPINQI